MMLCAPCWAYEEGRNGLCPQLAPHLPGEKSELEAEHRERTTA